jgi:hypothetical protein
LKLLGYFSAVASDWPERWLVHFGDALDSQGHDSHDRHDEVSIDATAPNAVAITTHDTTATNGVAKGRAETRDK